MLNRINLSDKLALITEHWRPKVVGALNGHEVRLRFEPAAVTRNTGNVDDSTFTAPDGIQV